MHAIRRIAVFLFVSLATITCVQTASAQPDWSNTPDRVWLGADFWANPMEDWRVVDGEAECVFGGGGRNVHLLTHQLTDPSRPMELSVRVRRVEPGPNGGGAGFRIGLRSDIGDYRANCFVSDGIDAGFTRDGLVLGANNAPLAAPIGDRAVELKLTGRPDGDAVELTLVISDASPAKDTSDASPAEGTSGSAQELGRISARFPAKRLLGNVAIVNNFAPPAPRSQARQAGRDRYRFSKWTVGGEAFTVMPEHRFGPILWSMYTLSDSRSDDRFVLKLAALTGPLGPQEDPTVSLEIRDGDGWKKVDESAPHPDAWTATFRVKNWDASRDIPYRLSLSQTSRDGKRSTSYREGVVRANPSGRPLRMASLTCQNDYAFPYQPVVDNLNRLDPDLLYFSGDQIYESHGGFGIIRAPAEPAILNYLRKYYQFGWAFGDVMRSRPTIVLPDDHDVFQGNIWGEEGKAMDFSVDPQNPSRGGYHQPARMVNVVHTTCTSHHPDYPDRKPVKQEISVYHGDMVYGGVSFAIIADRQFKSGPERVKVDAARADHVLDPQFDTSKLDQPGLILLGERQEAFLRQWAEDWRGAGLKVLLSQTLFGAAATHHGKFDGYLKADLDSGSWPQTPRNSALRSLAASKALHLNGDQHLTSLVQYGIDRQRDSIWSFCAPAIAVGYPRWWRPDELKIPFDNRPSHALPNTGEYLDGFGNRIYVYAVGNPDVGTEKNRYQLAHQKGSGFGWVTIDPQAKTYKIEAFRFLVDATDGKPENRFPGWPLLLHQDDNGPASKIR